MDFNFKIIKTLSNRQSSLVTFQDPKIFKKKIFETVFDSTQNLEKLTRDFKKDNSFFCFSTNGNYMATDDGVYIVNNDFLFIKNLKALNIVDRTSYIQSFDIQSTYLFSSCLNKNNLNNTDNILAIINPKDKFLINIDDISTQKTIKNLKTNYISRLANHPFNSYLFSYNDGNNLFIHDMRSIKSIKINEELIRPRTDIQTIGGLINSLQFNPVNDHLLLVNARNENGLYLFDIRNLQTVFSYDLIYHNKNFLSSSAKYNRKGNQIFVTRYFSKPVLYSSDEPYPLFEFDEIGLHCSNGMLSSCFAGPNDEFVVCNSANATVYLWELPKQFEKKNFISTKINSAKFSLKKLHKVKKVAYNYQNSVLACYDEYQGFTFHSPFIFSSKSDLVKENKMNSDNHNEIFWEAWGRLNFLNLKFLKINEANYSIMDYQKIKNVNDFAHMNVEEELNNDLNINYMKSFINNHNVYGEIRKINLRKVMKKFFDKHVKFEEKVVDGSFFTVFFELFKVFKTKIFIKNSVLYLRKKLIRVNNLIEEIDVIKQIDYVTNWADKKKI